MRTARKASSTGTRKGGNSEGKPSGRRKDLRKYTKRSETSPRKRRIEDIVIEGRTVLFSERAVGRSDGELASRAAEGKRTTLKKKKYPRKPRAKNEAVLTRRKAQEWKKDFFSRESTY